MSEKEKKRQRINHLLYAVTKPKLLSQQYTKQKYFFTEKEIFYKMSEWRMEQKDYERSHNVT